MVWLGKVAVGCVIYCIAFRPRYRINYKVLPMRPTSILIAKRHIPLKNSKFLSLTSICHHFALSLNRLNRSQLNQHEHDVILIDQHNIKPLSKHFSIKFCINLTNNRFAHKINYRNCLCFTQKIRCLIIGRRWF